MCEKRQPIIVNCQNTGSSYVKIFFLWCTPNSNHLHNFCAVCTLLISYVFPSNLGGFSAKVKRKNHRCVDKMSDILYAMKIHFVRGKLRAGATGVITPVDFGCFQEKKRF